MKKNSIFRWGVAMLLLFTGLSLRAYAEDDGGSPFRKNHDVDLTVKSATLQTFTDAFTKQTGVLFSYESALASMPMGDVSVRESNAPLERILNNVFTKRGFRYKIVDRTVVLTYDRTAEPQRKNSVTGRVCDAAGSPLVGATVLVKDSTRGTTTGADGTYSVEAEPGAVLLFSYIGYTEREEPVGSRSVIDVTMQEDQSVLEEVVVVGYGTQTRKTVTSAISKMDGKTLESMPVNLVGDGMKGRIAGLQVATTDATPGSAPKFLIRGGSSINNSNDPIVLVDGAVREMAGLNPNDIESIEVLKDAASAGIYGSRASNGVILITTKKGKEGRVRVNYSNSTTFSHPFVMPKFQNTYGTSEIEPMMSWGSKLATPTSYDPADFFQTGFNETNSVGLSAGTERNQTYASASAVNSRGIVPNNVYNRYNFSIRNTTILIKDRLTLDVGATYMKQYTRNQTVQGQYRNPLVGIYLFPRGNDIRKYEIYERPGSDSRYMEQFWDLEFLKGVENPWWITNRELNENRQHRYSFNATMKLDITDWMSLTGRIRTDNATINYTRKLSASTNTLFASKYGSYLNRTMTHNNLYGDVLLSIDKSFCDNAFSLQFNLGASIMDNKNQLTGYEGYLAGIPNKFTYNNIISDNSQSFPTQENYHDQIQAVYATMQLGWRGMLYVDVSVRNDWASMLAFTPKQNIFYPSVGLSAVISSMTDLSKAGISFLKVRGSYAEVGNAPERYITGPNYTLTNGVVSTATIAPAKHLEAERTKSFEAGLDVKFLGNKISATATYYNTNTYNQLFLYDAPPSSGYKQKYINAGKVNNWGIEASAGYKNTWRDFSWATTLNFSMNRNKIKELVPEGTRDPDTGSLVDIKEVNKDYGGYRVKLVEGGSIGDFYVKGLLTDDKGHIYVDPNSNTVLLDPDPEAYIFAGNTEARFRWGWNNQFSYKGVSLGVLIDARIGGRGVSATQALMDRFGVSQDSADARENGGVWISDDQQVPDAKTFYANSGDGMAMLSHYVYSMTNVRLRELTLGYDLPSKWFRNKVNMSVSFVGRNLFMFYNKAPFDPEVTASTSTYYQGVDFFMQPSVRPLGFSVKLQF